jgi:hypothetical protein
MQEKLTLDLSFCLDEKGFSLDEFITVLGNTFKEENGLAKIASLILQLYQESLLYHISKKSKQSITCCGQSNFVLNGSYKRRIRTTLGEINLNYHRIKCKECNKDITPLKESLDIDNYQTKTTELEEVIMNAISETSYRRAVNIVNEHGLINIPYRTAHDWVMQTDCDEIKLPADMINSAGPLQIFADGTGFKGAPKNGKSQKGDFKTIIGVNTEGEVFPLGSYTDKSWSEISQIWKESNLQFSEGSVFISDGALGLSEAFADQIEFVQRCQWHVGRDLYHAMNANGGTTKDSKPLQKGLAGVLAIELPEKDFCDVSNEEKEHIETKMENAQVALDKLITHLDDKGYEIASRYIQRAKYTMFSYIKRWFKYGLVCPRASSLIERVTRELARRLKRIAYNWSDKGCAKIAKIVLKKFVDKEEWDNYWEKKKSIRGKVFFSIKNYKLSQNFAH